MRGVNPPPPTFATRIHIVQVELSSLSRAIGDLLVRILSDRAVSLRMRIVTTQSLRFNTHYEPPTLSLSLATYIGDVILDHGARDNIYIYIIYLEM